VGENQFLMVQEEELEAAQQEARARPKRAGAKERLNLHVACRPETDGGIRRRLKTRCSRVSARVAAALSCQRNGRAGPHGIALGP